jgi:hypothetical protein
MQYCKVFYTDVQLPAGIKQPNLSSLMPREFTSKDDALGKAFRLINLGAIVWKIEGPEGFCLDRTEIEKQYWISKTT